MEFWSEDVDAVGRDDMAGTGSGIGDWRARLDDLLEVVRIWNGTVEDCCLGGERSDWYSYDWTADVFDCTDEMHGLGYWRTDNQRHVEVMEI